MRSPWTPERTARLVELLNGPDSITGIAYKMGMSKGQVSGKAYREGLLHGKAIVSRQAVFATPSRRTSAPLLSKLSTCRWIFGERGIDFARYEDARRCGATVKSDSSYCPVHHVHCHAKQEVVV